MPANRLQLSTQPVTRAGLRSLNPQPLLRVMTPGGDRFIWLAKGRAGNLQTASEMAALVREDSMRDDGLGRFAAQLLINAGLDSHSDEDEILDRVFRYVQQISYIHDPGGSFDAIHSARETVAKGYGDCDDLSVLLATFLALLGFTPAFVLAKYDDNTNGFDHVYVQVETAKGQTVILDPTTRKHGIGWENPRSIDRVVFPIFGPEGALNSLGGAVAAIDVNGLINTGIALFSAAKAGKASKAQQEAARWAGHEDVMAAMNQIQAAIDACQITAEQGAAAARQVVAAFYQNCDAAFSKDLAKSCRNYGAEAGGFDAHIAKIANGNSGCALAMPVSLPGTANGASAAGSSTLQSSGGLSVSLPVALAIGLGVLLVLKK